MPLLTWTKSSSLNLQDAKLLEKFMKDIKDGIPRKDARKNFEKGASIRYTKGEWQWGDKSYNIRRSDAGCKHACVYCYVTPLLQRFGQKLTTVDDIEEMPLDSAKVSKGWRKATSPAVYFFPSTHDIFIENMVEYVEVCRKMIDAGHQIMYVSKPHLEGTKKFVEEVNKLGDEYKKSFATWVTITTNNDKLIKEWEPHAPCFAERVECLKYLHANGSRTCIMCEPYLSDPFEFLPALTKYVKGVVAVGVMNYTASLQFDEDEDIDAEMKKYLEQFTNRRKLVL